MAWKDVGARLRGFFGGKNGTGSRRPDGGTSCYRPVQRRDAREESLAREKAAEYAAAQPAAAYAHTGFTGMNPPMSGPMPAAQQTLDGAWRRAEPQQGYAQAGQQAPQGYGAAGQQARQVSGWSGPQPVQPDNISYMPMAYMQGAGSSYTHVEHILAITSLRSCYEAIECMKNGETLIVTLDVLGSEGERIRCQDMLAGAAFTLGCSVRTLQSAGIVVIVPQGVKILPEQQAPTYAQRTAEPQQAPVREGWTPRRERRTSQNPMGWDSAGAQNRSYNPYTGTMPAAAGDYGMFGGY